MHIYFWNTFAKIKKKKYQKVTEIETSSSGNKNNWTHEVTLPDWSREKTVEVNMVDGDKKETVL